MKQSCMTPPLKGWMVSLEIALQKYSMKIYSSNLVVGLHLIFKWSEFLGFESLIWCEFDKVKNLCNGTLSMIKVRMSTIGILYTLNVLSLQQDFDCDWRYLCNGTLSNTNVRMTTIL